MRSNAIKLSDHFTVGRLLKFTFPSIAMMIFTSVYGVVDGFFVSNYVGKTPFAALNFIMPFLMMLGAVGFMFGTGGCALVARTMGEGKSRQANQIFSFLIYTSAFVGIAISVLGFVFLRPVAATLGAEGEMLEFCVIYGRILLAANPAFILQMEFQSFFIAAEKPKLGFICTVISGVANMILDALLVAVFPLGLTGAAWATALSQVIGAVIPMVYFSMPNSSLLRFTKADFNGGVLLKTCINGSSELMTNVSMSLVGMLYNIQLLKYAGENGVAAYGVLMYLNFIFLAAYIGYSIGSAPIFSYHYGAANHGELKNLLLKSIHILIAFAIGMFILSEVMALPLSKLFVGYDEELLKLTCRGFVIYSFSFLFAGFAIFSSGFFTALNDGLTSALISFLRTMLFQTIAVLLLPLIFGIDGIWAAIVVAEALAVAVSALFIVKKREIYYYL